MLAGLAVAAIVAIAITINLLPERPAAVAPPNHQAANPDPQLAPRPPQIATVTRPIAAPAELADLIGQVNRLESEVDATAKKAELLDARRQASELIASYSQW
jgi:hypothetical protein